MSVRESSAGKALCAVCGLIFNTKHFLYNEILISVHLSQTAEEQVKAELPAETRPHSKPELSSDATLNGAHGHLLRGQGKGKPDPPNSQR